MTKPAPPPPIIHPMEAANAGGLVYVTPDEPGIRRRKHGKGFRYLDAGGAAVRDPATLDRIQHLVIPPAWRDVWICPSADGHLQAVGFDEKGRRQYLYHPRFRALREEAKFEHMIAFADALPALRERVAKDMSRPGLGREKVLATVVHLLETTMIRVGNAAYAKENGSFGLTTLRVRHVKIEGSELRFQFKGKSGKDWRLGIRDRRVARIVKACQELPGQQLFQYIDDDGDRQTVTSSDVNAYLKAATGGEVTAKDFRTWIGTVLAATSLMELGGATSPTAAKRMLSQAIKTVSDRLGNTPTVCRKCYVHPEVMTAYLAGELVLDIQEAADAGLDAEEAAVLAFLRARLTTLESSARAAA
jgi:DNA topoisomerase-1